MTGYLSPDLRVLLGATNYEKAVAFLPYDLAQLMVLIRS